MLQGERVRLVYVASIGRSGSTLLELLLGAHEDIATVGELHLWPHELRPGGRHLPCGCGLPIEACPFWQEMARRVDPLGSPPPRLDAFREEHTGGRTLRLGRLLDFLIRPRPEVDQEVATYADNTERTLRAFADLTEETTGRRPDWLVDASKDPYRLAWLVRSGRFDIRVLHVVRDPRGFVSSESKNLDDPGDLRLLRLAARKGGAWSVQNQLVRLAARSLGPSGYLLVPYERLAHDPVGTLERVGDALGHPLGPELIERFRRVSTHAIGGNPMRHDDRPIALDEQWRRTLPVAAQRLALATSVANRRAFGY